MYPADSKCDRQASSQLSLRGLSSQDVWNFENAYYWFSHPGRVSKLLAHFELYKSITTLPGDVWELGVYKAASLVRFATYRSVLESDFSRKIVGFDAFGRFPIDNLSLPSDRDFIKEFERAGGDGLTVDEVHAILNRKNFPNVELVAGNIINTLPKYIDSHPAARLSLLHLDLDVKEPTAYALDLLYDRLLPGGLILLDDYNAVAGATDAVDVFAKKRGIRLEKFPYYSSPAYIRKP